MKSFVSLMTVHIFAFVTMGLLTLSLSAYASSADTQAPAMADLLEQLSLTDSQQAQITPILQQSASKREAILAKHGIDPSSQGGKPDFRTLRQVSQDMQSLRADTEKQLASVLDTSQLDIFRSWQEHNRAAMRERLMGR